MLAHRTFVVLGSLLVLQALISTWPRASFAQTSSATSLTEAAISDAATKARQQFVRASELAELEDWPGALLGYQLAYQTFPHATTLYNIGHCYERLGDLATAWHKIALALRDEEHFPSRQLSAARRVIAQSRHDALEARLAIVYVEAPRKDLELKVDGQPLIHTGFAAFGPLLTTSAPPLGQNRGRLSSPGKFKIYLNAGRYDVTLKLGDQEQTSSLTLVERSRSTLSWQPETTATIPTRSRMPLHAGAARRRASQSSAPEISSVSSFNPLRVAGVSALVLGGGGFALALTAGLVVADVDRQLEAACSAGSCPRQFSGSVKRYKTAAALTNAGLLVGVVGTGAGLGLLWQTGSEERSAALHITPTSMRISGRF